MPQKAAQNPHTAGAQSGAFSDVDLELVAVIQAWASLPESVKTAVMITSCQSLAMLPPGHDCPDKPGEDYLTAIRRTDELTITLKISYRAKYTEDNDPKTAN